MSVDERDGPATSTATPIGHPELSKFKDALHTPFTFVLDDTRRVALTLDEITTRDVRSGWETFSLIFGGPSPPAFWEGLLDVEHTDLGSFSMFVVAVQTDGDGQQYQAVFNRPSS